MTHLTFDKQNFLASLRPGIVTLVVQSFENELEKEIEGAVERVYKRLRQQLPKDIEARIYEVFGPEKALDSIEIVVKLEG